MIILNALKSLGTHLLADLKKCNPKKLADIVFAETVMREAVKKSRATFLNIIKRDFDPGGPGGITILIGIAESHLSIHTWPEYGYAMIDILTCGENMDPGAAIKHLIIAFESQDPSVSETKRGIINPFAENLPHKPAYS